MLVIVIFLVIGAAASVVLLRPEWAPKISDLHAEDDDPARTTGRAIGA